MDLLTDGFNAMILWKVIWISNLLVVLILIEGVFGRDPAMLMKPTPPSDSKITKKVVIKGDLIQYLLRLYGFIN